MRALFIITGTEMGTWLSEVTHPYWHLVERGIAVDFASPAGGAVRWTSRSDPYTEESQEAGDLVSKGFLSDQPLMSCLATTKRLKDIDPAAYDFVHVAGGRGATFDLYPNTEVTAILEHFWSHGKIVGAICHGAVALANVPGRIAGRRVTGFSLAEDRALEHVFGSSFIIPHYPQTSLEKAGARYSSAAPGAPHVVVDGRLITGQNQQSASEYGIALARLAAGAPPLDEAVGDRAGASVDDSLEIVRRFYSRLASGDIQGALDLLHPEVEWTEAERTPYFAGKMHGVSAVVSGLLEPLQRDFESFATVPGDYITQGPRVAAFGTSIGVARTTSRPMSAPFVHVWTVKEQRLGRFAQYTDSAVWAQALGLAVQGDEA